MRGGVRGTPAPEALESDSRGACAPLDASFTGYRNGISHQGVLHCTNKQTSQTSAPDSIVTTTPHQKRARSTSICSGHRTPPGCHEQCTAASLRPTNDTRTVHGGFLASGHREGGKGAQRPPKGADRGWRVPEIRTWTHDDNSSPRRPRDRPVMNLVLAATQLRALTCADSQGGQWARGQMGGLEGASEAPSSGRQRERRAWLTSSL